MHFFDKVNEYVDEYVFSDIKNNYQLLADAREIVALSYQL